MAIKQINKFVQSNNHTNIILINLPHRFDLIQSSCVKSEIRSFNRKLMKSTKSHKHVSILEMCSDKKHFTNHGLHLNSLGKKVMEKKIISHTYALLDKKKNTPIILNRSPVKTSTDIQHHGIVLDRMTIKTKVTPVTTSDDLIRKEDCVPSGDNNWIDNP